MTDAQKVVEAVLVRVTDWDGLYIGGELVGEGDSMDLPWELDGKTVSFRYREGTEEEDQYVTDHGGFPDTFEELVNTNR